MESLNAPLIWRYLIFMRPTRWADAWSYYVAVLRGITGRAFGNRTTISQQLSRPLHVRCDHVTFSVRQGTDDLAMAALSVDPLQATRFFRPAPGDTVIDVGANIGGYALRAALVAKTVIAIEPEPNNFRQLRENIRLNKLTNVIPMQVAISDASGTSMLYLASDSGRHSLEASSWGQPTGQSLDVELMTLDEVVVSLGIDRINWLKVDVERHELPALIGAAHALSITQNLILEFEVAKWPIITEILTGHGLAIIWRDLEAENSVLLATSDVTQ